MLKKIQSCHISRPNDDPRFSINKNSAVRVFVRYDSQHIIVSKILVIKNDKTSMVELSLIHI